MRGNPTPKPSYSPNVAGLLRWLRQPPSQWSALGWQNAPAWADAIERSELERGRAIYEQEKCRFDCDSAIADRDEARRQYCRGFTDFCPNPAHDNLSLEEAAVEVARSFGWDCFEDYSDEGKVNP
jgi:hypothetical protein